ncbi:MAG TPA: GGDEF domain-containing protein [Usitatibacter sp.]|nr:GGDEF domain-containing protein [Usitatibacter sp.]
MSRAQTLVLALLVLHFLLGALSLAIGRGEHKSAALRWWGAGLLAYALGLSVTLAGILGARSMALTVGNGLITAAPVLCAIGVLAHTRMRLHFGWISAGVAATVLVLGWNNFSYAPSPMVNLAAPSIMAVVMFLLAAFVILREGPRESAIANQFLAAIMVLAVGTWVMRIAAMYTAMQGSDDLSRVDAIVSFFAIAQMVNGVGATLALFWIDVRIMQAELGRVAHTDSLTGLPNRRAILQRFQVEVARAARHKEKLAIALLDLDHFKRVNDARGHAVGDEMLKAAAAAFMAAKRDEDVLARIGGEEFMVVLASCRSLEGAVQAAERMREALSRVELRAGGEALHMTASGGVALYPDEGADWDTLFTAADRRLYAAKAAGRNLVVASE